MKFQTALFLIAIFLIQSCSPKVKSKLTGDVKYDPLDTSTEVLVFKVKESAPEGSDFIGEIKVGDTGFSTDCDYFEVLKTAKSEARNSGANILKLTKILRPGTNLSNCYRLKAKLYRNYNEETNQLLAAKALENKSQLSENTDYAMVYFYRPHNYQGSLITYKIRMDEDSIIGKATDSGVFAYKITSFGEHKFWGKTETATSVTINVEKGKEYYFRCGLKMGLAVGRPTIVLMESSTGRNQYKKLESNE